MDQEQRFNNAKRVLFIILLMVGVLGLVFLGEIKCVIDGFGIDDDAKKIIQSLVKFVIIESMLLGGFLLTYKITETENLPPPKTIKELEKRIEDKKNRKLEGINRKIILDTIVLLYKDVVQFISDMLAADGKGKKREMLHGTIAVSAVVTAVIQVSISITPPKPQDYSAVMIDLVENTGKMSNTMKEVVVINKKLNNQIAKDGGALISEVGKIAAAYTASAKHSDNIRRDVVAVLEQLNARVDRTDSFINSAIDSISKGMDASAKRSEEISKWIARNNLLITELDNQNVILIRGLVTSNIKPNQNLRCDLLKSPIMERDGWSGIDENILKACGIKH